MIRRRAVDAAESAAPAPESPVPVRKPGAGGDAVRVPHDAVNEQVLIVAACGASAVRKRLTERVPADLFLVKEHVEWWLVLTELARKGLEYDGSTVRQLSGGTLDPEYVARLIADRGGTLVPNVDHHIAMLEWDRTRVDTVRGPLAQLLDGFKDPRTTPERMRELGKQVSTALERGSTASMVRSPEALVQSALAEYQARKEKACFPYGLEGLDMEDNRQKWRMVPGAAPKKLTVITAVPGSGKSVLACRIALAQAMAGRRVLFGAWEQGDEDTLHVLAAMHLGWSRYALSTATLTPEQERGLNEVAEEIAACIKFMELPGREKSARGSSQQRSRLTNDRVLDIVQATIEDTGADVAIFDLWKRCLVSTEPDEEEQALYRQQQMLKETRCHGILLQQQRLKDVEARPDKRPTREGIKGSGTWVEVADTILGVHRPALWKPVDDVVIEIDVLKQRWAPWPQAIEFDWNGEHGSITGGTTVPYDQSPGVMTGSGNESLTAPTLDAFLGKKKPKKKG